MPRNKFRTVAEAVALVSDGATVGLVGGGSGLQEAGALFAEVERRFLETGHPAGLTLVHALGIGDKAERGLNRFAHRGLVSAVIGGHWVWSPRMQALAADNEIEAYVLPGGVVGQLYREIGAGRPGLFTHVGLGTFVDPRHGGGRMNAAATRTLADVLEIDGREVMRYRPFPVDIALLRGSYADADGNISFAQECANLDMFDLALAAHNSGGKVIVQVRTAVDRGTIPARDVHIPGAWVDAVVVDPTQSMTYDIVYDPTMSGEVRGPVPPRPPETFTERVAVARRAALELRDDAVVNYGFGMPDLVARIVADRGDTERYYQTIEHGVYGGDLLTGSLFGFGRNATAYIHGPSQFDFYAGGGLDLAFLGFGEFDAQGNVNVSMLGGVTVGPGGFMDIAANARKVVFCGTFEAKGLRVRPVDGRLVVDQPGSVPKVVTQVDQVTFSGPQAVARGQEVLYVTERAVFRLTPEGIVLAEVAPGIDVQTQVLDRMGFAPLLPQPPAVIDGAIFRE